MIFLENFEEDQGTEATSLADYVGAAGQTYTADPYWLDVEQCNGVILQYASATFPDEGWCPSADISHRVHNNVMRLADVLGQVEDGIVGSDLPAFPVNESSVQSSQNHAVTAWTANEDGPDNAIMLESSDVDIAVEGLRFIVASVAVAETSCEFAGGENNSRLLFSLNLASGNVPLTDEPIVACQDPRAHYYTSPTLSGGWGNGGEYVAAGRFYSDGSLLLDAQDLEDVGVVLRNEKGAQAGNDAGIDDIQLVDATPQLDKQFDPARVPLGQTSTLTFTVTNTSDLAAKEGWSFTDDLPAGLTIADPENIGGTCEADVDAAPGGTSINVTDGVLSEDEESCTVTVEVTSAIEGEYQNDESNFSTLVGLNPPDLAEVEFYEAYALSVSKTSTLNEDSRLGDDITYTVTATNVGETDYSEEHPAIVVDDLSDVIDDAVYEGDAAADQPGEISYDEPLLSWVGELAVDETVELTYTVTLVRGGNGFVRNVAWVPSDPDDPVAPSCDPPEDGVDPTTREPCAETEGEFSTIEVEKSSDPESGSTVQADDEITYTLHFENTGSVTAPVDYLDNLTEVLDNAELVTEDPESENGFLEVTQGRIGADSYLFIEGDLPAGESDDVIYTVRVLPLDERSDPTNYEFGNVLAPWGMDEPDCDDVGVACTEHGISELRVQKMSDPETGSIVQTGDEIHYTLRFETTGDPNADPVAVDYVDDLTHVLNNAELIEGPDSQWGDLTAELVGSTLHVTGELDPNGDNDVITYTVKVLPYDERDEEDEAGERGRLENVLAPTGMADPECGEPGVECTEHLIPELVQMKSVEADTDPVGAGTELTYTLHFENLGGGEAEVETVDDVSGVLDDAELISGPVVGWDGLEAQLVGDAIRVTGTVSAYDWNTVTYTVRVKPDGERGDDVAKNFLLAPGETPPDECVPPSEEELPQCTITEISSLLTRKDVVADSDPVDSGTTLTYTLTFEYPETNPPAGPVAVDFTDDLSDVLDDASVGTQPESSDEALAVTTIDPVTGTFSIVGNLQPAQIVTITYSVVVKAQADRGNNSAANFLIRSGQDTPTICAEDNVNCTVTPLPEIVARKSADPPSGSTVAAGEGVTYTLTFENTGGASGYVDYTDELSGVLDNATWTGTPVVAPEAALSAVFDGDSLRITGQLDPGQPVTVSYAVTVLPDTERAGDRLGNFVVVTGEDPPDECATTDSMCTEHLIPRLRSWKEVSADPMPTAAGTVLTYTVYFENTGSGAAEVAAIDDLTFVLNVADLTTGPDSAEGLTASRAGSVINITGEVAADQTSTVEYQVTVKPDSERDADVAVNFLLGAGEAPPADPVCEPEDREHPDCTTAPIGRVVTSKTVESDSDPIEEGSVLRYTLHFRNDGQGPGHVDYTDHLSDVLDDATLTSGPIASSDALSASPVDTVTGSFTVTGDLAPAQVVDVTYEVTVTPQADRGNHSAVNFLIPTGQPPGPGSTCDPSDQNCTATGLPVIGASKSSDPASGSTVLPGQEVTYTLAFTNAGDGPGSVDYTDDLAEVLLGADLIAAPIADGGLLEPDLSVDGTLQVTGVLGAGQSETVSYRVRVKPDAERSGDTLGNFLVVTGREPPSECVAGDPSCTEHVIPRLASWKTVSADSLPVFAGTVLTYTLFFENSGTASARVDAVDDLTQVLDDGDVTGEPMSPNGLTVARSGPTISIVGEVPAGETYVVTYQVTVRPDGERGDDIAVNFLVPAGELPPELPVCQPEDVDRPDCTVTPIGKLVTFKSVEADSEPLTSGSLLTYTLTFNSQGTGSIPVDYTDYLDDVLDDAELTGLPVSSDPQLTVSPVIGDRFTVTGALDPGQIVTVTYSVTLKDEAERGNNSAANFLAPGGLTPPQECASSDSNCTVTPLPRIGSAKSSEPESGLVVEAGQEVAYALTFTNTGEAAGTLDYTDDLSGVLDDADLISGPTVSDPAVNAVLFDADGILRVDGILEHGQTVTVNYTVTVRPDGQHGDNLLGNHLVKTGEAPPADCADDNPNCTEHPTSDIAATKSVNPASGTPVVAGQQLTYTLTFTNDGKAAGEVDMVDDISHVLDDATLTSEPVASDPALEVVRVDSRIALTGTLQQGQTVTVSYTVAVKPTEERGNNIIANYLLQPDQVPSTVPDCRPGEGDLPDCTTNPVGDIVPSKSVSPESGSQVKPRDTLTYTVTFTNAGRGDATVDYTDHLDGVLDSADWIGVVQASNGLTVTGPSTNELRITGQVEAGHVGTVAYEVHVKADVGLANHQLSNYVTVTGDTPPPECVPQNPLCTQNPLVPSPSDLPVTGRSAAGVTSGILAALVLLAFGGTLALHRRRARYLD